MAAVFAGFVTGYAFSLLFTAFASLMLVSARSRVPYLAKAIAPNINAVMLAVPVSLIAFLGWTLAGLLLGLLYKGATDNLAGGGLGSPNWPFTLGVLLAAGARRVHIAGSGPALFALAGSEGDAREMQGRLQPAGGETLRPFGFAQDRLGSGQAFVARTLPAGEALAVEE